MTPTDEKDKELMKSAIAIIQCISVKNRRKMMDCIATYEFKPSDPNTLEDSLNECIQHLERGDKYWY